MTNNTSQATTLHGILIILIAVMPVMAIVSLVPVLPYWNRSFPMFQAANTWYRRR